MHVTFLQHSFMCSRHEHVFLSRHCSCCTFRLCSSSPRASQHEFSMFARSFFLSLALSPLSLSLPLSFCLYFSLYLYLCLALCSCHVHAGHDCCPHCRLALKLPVLPPVLSLSLLFLPLISVQGLGLKGVWFCWSCCCCCCCGCGYGGGGSRAAATGCADGAPIMNRCHVHAWHEQLFFFPKDMAWVQLIWHLRQLDGLSFVFINGCSSESRLQGSLKAGPYKLGLSREPSIFDCILRRV